MSTQFQVPYAGVHTFARAALGSVQTLRPGNVAVFGVAQSSSGLRQGMHDAPRAIREASADFIYPLQSAGTLMDIETAERSPGLMSSSSRTWEMRFFTWKMSGGPITLYASSWLR